MTVSLKPLADQIVVITGASSGIGLVTAKLAAGRGAKVVLVARNEAALEKAVEGIRAEGVARSSRSRKLALLRRSKRPQRSPSLAMAASIPG